MQQHMKELLIRALLIGSLSMLVGYLIGKNAHAGTVPSPPTGLSAR